MPGVRSAVALALVAVLALVLLPDTRAWADTTVTVAAPGADPFLAGKHIGLVVTIGSDRLITGEVVAGTASGGPSDGDAPGDSPPDEDAEPTWLTAQAVEVPGGSRKDVVLVVPPTLSDPSSSFDLVVELRAQGMAPVREQISLRRDDGSESVGVLPVLATAGALPATAPLRVGRGSARLTPVTAPLLDAGAGAMEQFSTIVSAADELQTLAPSQRDALLRWVQQGGHLLVDAEQGPVGGLPEAWQPGPGGWHAAGAGDIRLTAGAAADGEWSAILEPTGQALAAGDAGKAAFEADVMQRFGIVDGGAGFVGLGGGDGSGPAATLDTLHADGGFALPDIGASMVLLWGFALVVGPVLFTVAGRFRRRPLLWVAVPVASVACLLGLTVTDDGAGSRVDGAHATLIEVTPVGSTAYTSALVGSISGGPVQIDLPPGWRNGSDASSDGGAGAGFDDVIPEDVRGFVVTTTSPTPGGPHGTTARALVQTVGASASARFELDPGAFAHLQASGPVADPPDVGVKAWAEGSTVKGEVRNGLGVDLHEVGVLLGHDATSIGTVKAGETKSFTAGHVDGGVMPEGSLWSLRAEGPTGGAGGAGALGNGGFGGGGQQCMVVGGGPGEGPRNGGVVCMDVGLPVRGDFMEFDENGNPVVTRPPAAPSRHVSGGVWLDYAARKGSALRQMDAVTVVGWSDALPSPFVVEAGRRISRGRTAIAVHAPMEVRERLRDAGVRIERVRDAEDRGFSVPDGEVDIRGVLWRVLLPATIDGQPLDPERISLTFPRGLDIVAVRDGDGWQLKGANVFRNEAVSFRLSPGMVHRGVVYLKTGADGTEMLERDRRWMSSPDDWSVLSTDRAEHADTADGADGTGGR